ncbi:hypothetical protein Turpa_3422 [Turneriella parva DSM 21527]|uniref:Uncharacterized protein n=1 Tax=Turneriella parva (strain ATCC BAA-1111 / DSM 21527 / NCTC 11395 / H) TaxID=869212 RepID=I4B9V2_TURPD|nr:hypothetical protein Turpa_3422 [Turneriella parva DSM 21527]
MITTWLKMRTFIFALSGYRVIGLHFELFKPIFFTASIHMKNQNF